jgi:hypothetical protein
VLKEMLMVTILALDLGQSEIAYRDYLGYQVVARGELLHSEATQLAAEQDAGADWVLMQPASAKPVYVRLLASPRAGQVAAMLQEGWTAAELTAQDPDMLSEQLADSPFRVVGPPAYLTPERTIKAMQALGPSGELLYFTHIEQPERSYFAKAQPHSFVDQLFITVLGSRNAGKTAEFYRLLGLDVTPPAEYRIGVLSRAYGLPEDTLYPLSLAVLNDNFLLELDGLPETALPIERDGGYLPGGVALMSFWVDAPLPTDLSAQGIEVLAAPVERTGPPYDGARVMVLRGAAGELLELVERPAAP